jgi:TPR repeat protein
MRRSLRRGIEGGSRIQRYRGRNGESTEQSPWDESGLAVAQGDLGACYYDGEGVPEDTAEAFHWYTRAVEQGDAWAQFNLGDCFIAGKGAEKNPAKAAGWYRKAANQGNADAQFALGECYEKGKGVGPDLALAKEWYGKAADQGSRKAKNALKRLAKQEAPSGDNSDAAQADEASAPTEKGP